MSSRLDMGHALVRLAETAGKAVMDVYATDFTVDHKSPGDPVTLADKRSNAIVVAGLAALYPGTTVVAEESDPSLYAHHTHQDRVFFVDPLDGTREFVAKNGEFAVMIGYAEKGRILCGVVHAPATDTTFMGVRDEGAWMFKDGTQTALRVTSCNLDESRVVVSRSRRSANLEQLLSKRPPKQVTPKGSAGIKASLVATGEADGYLQLGRAGALWDSAGPEGVIVGAGGVVCQEDGSLIDYTQEDVRLTLGLLVGSQGWVTSVVSALEHLKSP